MRGAQCRARAAHAAVAICPRCLPAAARSLPQVSAASAYVQTGAFNPARTLLLCLAATAIIGWLNLRLGAGAGLGGAAHWAGHS